MFNNNGECFIIIIIGEYTIINGECTIIIVECILIIGFSEGLFRKELSSSRPKFSRNLVLTTQCFFSYFSNYYYTLQSLIYTLQSLLHTPIIITHSNHYYTLQSLIHTSIINTHLQSYTRFNH